jgi:hypothetical protein
VTQFGFALLLRLGVKQQCAQDISRKDAKLAKKSAKKEPTHAQRESDP